LISKETSTYQVSSIQTRFKTYLFKDHTENVKNQFKKSSTICKGKTATEVVCEILYNVRNKLGVICY